MARKLAEFSTTINAICPANHVDSYESHFLFQHVHPVTKSFIEKFDAPAASDHLILALLERLDGCLNAVRRVERMISEAASTPSDSIRSSIEMIALAANEADLHTAAALA